MTSREQIDDAKYYLELLQDKNDRTHVRALLKGFLAVTRGAVDHLLEEYNVKFGLNIPLTIPLWISTFKEASKQSNITAQNFIKFYEKELKNFDKNSMWVMRNIRIHRAESLMHKHSHRVTNIENLKPRATFSIVAKDLEDNIKNNTVESPQQDDIDNEVNSNKEEHPEGGVKWFFDDDPNTEMLVRCRKFLSEIEGFVLKIETAFP